MLKWMFIVVLIISGGVLAYLYLNIKNLDTTAPSATSTPINAIRITHSFKDGVHRFSGEIKLPHSCYKVDTVAIQTKGEEGALVIAITTTDLMLEQRICAQFTTRYPFQLIVEAPEKAAYTLEVDKKVQPMRIVDVEWNNPNDTIIVAH